MTLLNRLFDNQFVIFIFAKINDVHPLDRGFDLAGFHGVIRLRLLSLSPQPAARTRFLRLRLFLSHRLGIGAFFFQKRVPVGLRDLVVIRMNLGKGQEPMTISAIVNESRLQRRFDPGYFCEIDIAS